MSAPLIRPALRAADRERCYAIRIAVFVDEQRIPIEEEIDDLDETVAHHVLLFDGEEPVATARGYARGRTARIGRFAVLPEGRGKGFGAALVAHLIGWARTGDFDEITLDAQVGVMPLYEKFGFRAEGPEFDDGGIPHRLMRLPLR